MRTGALEGADEGSLIQQVAGEERELAAQVGDAGVVGLGDAADEAEESAHAVISVPIRVVCRSSAERALSIEGVTQLAV